MGTGELLGKPYYMLGSNLRWTYILSRESSNTPGWLHAMEFGITSGSVGQFGLSMALPHLTIHCTTGECSNNKQAVYGPVGHYWQTDSEKKMGWIGHTVEDANLHVTTVTSFKSWIMNIFFKATLCQPKFAAISPPPSLKIPLGLYSARLILLIYIYHSGLSINLL